MKIKRAGHLHTLNSVIVLYSFASILSFIVLKSMGCLIIMEYPGAMASVTGKEKNPCGSFLLRQKDCAYIMQI